MLQTDSFLSFRLNQKLNEYLTNFFTRRMEYLHINYYLTRTLKLFLLASDKSICEKGIKQETFVWNWKRRVLFLSQIFSYDLGFIQSKIELNLACVKAFPPLLILENSREKSNCIPSLF